MPVAVRRSKKTRRIPFLRPSHRVRLLLRGACIGVRSALRVTILSAQSIRKRGIFTPFHERTRQNGLTFGLSACGYDVRIGQAVYIPAGGFVLASTLEHFDIPPDLAALVKDKSTWARRGICVQNTVAEPGWRGYLTLEITNHSSTSLFIDRGDPIAQIILELLDEPTEAPYAGKYQDQANRPVEAIIDR